MAQAGLDDKHNRRRPGKTPGILTRQNTMKNPKPRTQLGSDYGTGPPLAMRDTPNPHGSEGLEPQNAVGQGTQPPPRPPQEGFKDTLESIIIALILAFVFRAFVVEAFVIPTGSMAPTLYGAHGTIICEDCGYEFAYGLRDLDDDRRMTPVRSGSQAICSNCDHPNSNLTITDDALNAERGDRILVLKWPFDIGIDALGPKRWDVVVFKDPADGSTNFIKRLVGMPNEVLMILDGDIFTVPTNELSDEAIEALEAQRHEKYERQAHHEFTRLSRLPQTVFDEFDEKFRVARKSPEAQAEVWFNVYDHNFPPRSLDRGQPYWAPALGGDSGWNAKTRRVTFSYKGLPNDRIQLAGKKIVAENAYNIHTQGEPPPVSDQRVRFVWTPRAPDATVRVVLEKQGRFFWASLRADGYVELAESRDMLDEGRHVMTSARRSPFILGVPVRVGFENVDYRLALHVEEVEILASSSDPSSPAYYGPNIRALRMMMAHATSPRSSARLRPGQSPQLVGEGGDFDITHLLVERDIYYYHDGMRQSLDKAPWAPYGGWGSVESPMLLGEGEYFMLGDNTAASKDSRLWDIVGPHMQMRGEAFQLGTVPRDQLIGKAFFVYWPSGHRIEWLPIPLLNRMGIIPDVGRMRFIR
jgi:signal peptidase I